MMGSSGRLKAGRPMTRRRRYFTILGERSLSGVAVAIVEI